jgi:outer membrane receptor protein involved in Fe transport
MRVRVLALSVVCALLAALPMLAQGIPTGTLSGHVSSPDGKDLPGVTVTATSPSQQGTRSVTTNSNGDYNLPSLPPGEYQVTFELEGFQPSKASTKISAAQEGKVNADLQVTGVSEEIVVVGANETISTSPQASTTFEKKFVAALPVERDLRNTVLLTPGVSDVGPGGNARLRAITISGAQTYENLFLVNGVVVNENLRGQENPLFIEDAIEETTISTAGISAEYGRFAGGVVNVLTKSGGNEVSGSIRTVLTDDQWASKTPLTTTRANDVNKRYEATLGGFVLRDRLWYFLSGRDFKNSLSRSTTVPGANLSATPYDNVTNEKRYEGKLTLSPWVGHRLVGSYIKIKADEVGNSFGNILDLDSLVTRSTPQELQALNYSGIFTDNFFVEAQWSKRKFTFENSGSQFTDRIKGTLLVDGVTGNRWNSPTFCGVCRPENRDNENKLVKGSWFFSTGGLGSHDVSAGYDTFSDIRTADNHQSGSDFRIIALNYITRNGQYYPQLVPDPNGNLTEYIQWNPILVSSQGTDFKTNSVFLNDKWRLNDHLSFNLGLRYDKNDGVNSEGQKTAKDSRVSPRLAASWDPKGNGDWVVNASYSQYVNSIANGQGDSSSRGGNPAAIRWYYRGPAINADPNGPLLSNAEALAQIFAWFDSQGGTNNTSNLRLVSIPGGTTVIRGSLDSPYTDEIALGFSKRLGNRGVARMDYVHRVSKDFYSQRTDRETGRVSTVTGPADLTVLENSNAGLDRRYDGLFTQFQVRLSERLNVGGFWTLSHLRGNVVGETTANGPVPATLHSQPEYLDRSWFAPEGDLGIDQRHRIRLWGLYDLYTTDRNQLSLSIIENYFSGTPYGAVGAVNSRPFVTGTNYETPPPTVTYYFTGRDTFHTDNISATDLALNYSFRFQSWGKGVEIYLQPLIQNVFNEHGVLNVNTSVRDATTNPRRCPASNPTCNPLTDPAATGFFTFNPFTTSPVENTHWQKGPNFGKPVNQLDYQTPRTYRFSVGFRF